MSYAVIQPPFTLRFREMSHDELKGYYDWFQSVLPQRIEQLESEIRRSPGRETWNANGDPSTFDTLGDWFAGEVETRPRTQAEKDALHSTAPWVSAPDVELTNRTFSLAMDIGMYLGRSIVAARPGARWEQPLDNKKFADHGQPVIVGLGVVPLNPVRIAVTLAYGIASGRQSGARLRGLYDYWVKQGA